MSFLFLVGLSSSYIAQSFLSIILFHSRLKHSDHETSSASEAGRYLGEAQLKEDFLVGYRLSRLVH